MSIYDNLTINFQLISMQENVTQNVFYNHEVYKT